MLDLFSLYSKIIIYLYIFLLRWTMLSVFPAIGLLLSIVSYIIIRPENPFLSGILYFLGYTLLSVIIFLVFLLILSFFIDTGKTERKFSRFYNYLISEILRAVLVVCNVKVKIEGLEKIPEKGRFVLVQNHKAMFDPIITVAFLRKYEIGFISKPENFRIPVIGKFMHEICCIPIDRENARNAVTAINTAVKYIKEDNCSIAVYPEGTRARDGGMLPLHAGSFKIATKTGVPLVITTVDNTNLVHRNAPFRRTEVTLRICEVIPGEEVSSLGTAELSEMTRKIMCDSLGIPEEE